ncbi:MAG: hypothetical protein ACRDSL_24895 [Pseudonocardiaceae bacterium]
MSRSLRLPKSLLDWVRAQARTEHTKPTQLIRRWIEERRTTGEPSLEERVRRLEDLVQPGSVAPEYSGCMLITGQTSERLQLLVLDGVVLTIVRRVKSHPLRLGGGVVILCARSTS